MATVAKVDTLESLSVNNLQSRMQSLTSSMDARNVKVGPTPVNHLPPSVMNKLISVNKPMPNTNVRPRVDNKGPKTSYEPLVIQVNRKLPKTNVQSKVDNKGIAIVHRPSDVPIHTYRKNKPPVKSDKKSSITERPKSKYEIQPRIDNNGLDLICKLPQQETDEVPAMCVDAVQELMEMGDQFEEVTSIISSVDHFHNLDLKYDKLYIKGAVHSFPRDKLLDIFLGVSNQLKDGGYVLIDKLPDDHTHDDFPWIKQAIEESSSVSLGLQPLLLSVLEKVGFSLELIKEVRSEGSLRKEELLELLRLRSEETHDYLSGTGLVEEGVRLLEEQWAGQDVVTWVNRREIIVARKLTQSNNYVQSDQL